jgi:Transposase zinc-binding domain
MAQANLELADIFRRHGEAWRAANAGHISHQQQRVMKAIETCRTAALGGHVERCQNCAHTDLIQLLSRSQLPQVPGLDGRGLASCARV